VEENILNSEEKENTFILFIYRKRHLH